jgi:hypothetical protein
MKMSNDFDDTTPEEAEKTDVSRRSVLEYFNPAGYRVRRMFGTREKVIEGLKTFAWVIPLTVLIWIYAERQQLVQNPVVVPGVGVRIQNNDPSRIVQINGPEDPTFTLKLMGPQEGVRKVIDQLTQHIPREKLLLVVGANRPIQDNQRINIADAIQNQDLLKSNGVTVQEVQPPDLSVNIDILGRRSVDVHLPPDKTNMSATFEPAKVTVLGPESLLKDLGADLKAYPRLDGYSQLNTSGTYPLKSVPVELSAPAHLQVDPNHVDATVQVSQSDEVYEITDPVLVYVDARPVTLAKYSITFPDESINKVVVKGPKEQIEKIQNHEFIPRANLEISAEDAATKTSITPKFDLPPNVQVVNPEALKPINFTATQR